LERLGAESAALAARRATRWRRSDVQAGGDSHSECGLERGRVSPNGRQTAGPVSPLIGRVWGRKARAAPLPTARPREIDRARRARPMATRIAGEDTVDAIVKAAVGETAKQTIGSFLRQVLVWAVAPLGLGVVTEWTIYQLASAWAHAHPFLAGMGGIA